MLYSYQIILQIHVCLKFTDMIWNYTENGKHTGMILIDLQNAFYTLAHKVLLDKMKCMGFSDAAIKLFLYLTYRAFYVSFGTVFSEAGTIWLLSWR